MVPADDFTEAKLIGRFDRKTRERLPGYGGYLVRYYLDRFPGVPYEHDARIVINDNGTLYDVTGDPFDKSYTPDVPAPPRAEAGGRRLLREQGGDAVSARDRQGLVGAPLHRVGAQGGRRPHDHATRDVILGPR
jgi:hypothetical protein